MGRSVRLGLFVVASLGLHAVLFALGGGKIDWVPSSVGGGTVEVGRWTGAEGSGSGVPRPARPQAGGRRTEPEDGQAAAASGENRVSSRSGNRDGGDSALLGDRADSGLPGDGAALAPSALGIRAPEYPELARLRGEHGSVTVVVVVNERRELWESRVERGSGFPLLDQAAITAVRASLVAAAEGQRHVRRVQFVFSLEGS